LTTLAPHPHHAFPYTPLFRSAGSGRASIHREITPGSWKRPLRLVPVVDRVLGNGGTAWIHPRRWASTSPRRRSPNSRRSTSWAPDRKSTRLNSSHVKISYAVF